MAIPILSNVNSLTSNSNITIPVDGTNHKSLLVASGSDYGTATIGRMVLGKMAFDDYAGWKHHDAASQTQYAMMQSSTFDTYINAGSGKTIYFRTNNSNAMYMTASAATFVGTIGSGAITSTGRVTGTQGYFGDCYMHTDGGYAVYGSDASNVPIAIALNGVASTAALKIDTSNNATFAGAVEINGIGTWNAPSGGVAFNVDAFTDGFGVIRFRTNGNASKWDVGINNSNHFYIGNNGVNTALEIEEVSSNATFAGTVTANGTTLTGNQDLSGYAPLASPALTGNPTAPTQSANDNSTKIATTAYVQTEITDLIGGAPGALDTLDELAAAIGDDASYAAGITTALGLKAPLAAPAFTGNATFVTLDVQPDADSMLRIRNAGTDAISIFADTGDTLYLGGNNTTGMYLDASANATFVGTVTGTNTIKSTSSSANNAVVQVSATGTGYAGFYGDASNGDFSGSDYFSIIQKNDLSVEFDVRANAGVTVFKSKGSTNLTMDGANSTFAGTVTWSGGGSANANTAYTHSQATHAPTNAEANVQSDWDASSGDALILNKPTIPAAESYTAHENISAASSSDNSGRTYIQDITVDSNGHVTGLATATETVTDTNTNQLTTFTLRGTTNTTATTVNHGDTITIAAGTGITTTSTSDGVVTIANTVVDTNTTYTSSDFTHDNLTGFVANEHIDWTVDQGSTNIHAGNYTDTNTTYSVGDGELSENNLTDALKTNYDAAYTYSQVGHLPLGGGTVTGSTVFSSIFTANGLSQFAGDTQFGVNGTGIDVKLFGDTAGAYLSWDQSEDKLLTVGGAVIDIVKDKLLIGGTAVTTTAAELNILDGATLTTTELNYVDGVTSAIQTQLDAKPDTNTTYTSSDFTHDDLTGFVANEHIDWTADQGGTNIHTGNYTNTTYASSDFTHDDLTGFVANEHIDWTVDQGGTNIHSGNYTNTDTTYSSSDFNHDDLTGFVANEHIDWTASSAGTIHASNYTDTNTTYSVGDGGLTENNLTDALKANYDAAYTHSQATHAPSGAEANVQSDWNASSGDALILNKPTIPGSFNGGTIANSLVVGADSGDTSTTIYGNANNLILRSQSGGTRAPEIDFNIAGTNIWSIQAHNNTSGISANTLTFNDTSGPQIYFYNGGNVSTSADLSVTGIVKCGGAGYYQWNNSNSTFWRMGSTGMMAGTRMGIEYHNGTSWQGVNIVFRNNGGLELAGALSKGSGSFKIDHPVESKKDTHYLVHSFVEAPQADNIYRGKVDLVNGKAEVNIDTVAGMTEGTLVALNTNIQCFTTNESNWDLVKGSVSGNKLTIESKNTSSTATISWMVIGERHDQHMKDTDWTDSDGRVIVEPEKD